MSIRILLVVRTPSTRYTENGNSYGTTLFGDGARFDRGGGRQVRGPVPRWNLMATRRSDETFLSLQALSSSHFVRRKRPFSTKCVWNQQAKARLGFDRCALMAILIREFFRLCSLQTGGAAMLS